MNVPTSYVRNTAFKPAVTKYFNRVKIRDCYGR